MSGIIAPTTLVDIMNQRSEITNKGITFISGHESEKFISYHDLHQTALRILYELQVRGAAPDTELIFQIDDHEFFLYLFWACILGGILAVPVTVGSNAESKMKLLKIWEILNKPILITTAKNAASIEKFAHDSNQESIYHAMKQNTILLEEISTGQGWGIITAARPEQFAFVQFSSGSTGAPKGVTLSHDNLVVNTKDINASLKTGPDDSMISWLPLTHDLGLIAVHLSGITAGLNQYLMPTPLFVKQPSLWLKKVHEHRVTQLYSPNFGYQHFLSFFDRPASTTLDLSCVRVILNGAEPISVDLCEKFMSELRVYGLKPSAMCAVYGLAEATVGVSGSPVEEGLSAHWINRQFLGVGQTVRDMAPYTPGSISFADEGYPASHCKIRINDDNGNVLGENIIGHIQISGRNVTGGYYNNIQATQIIITSGGWLRTGDLGFIRNQRLIVTGRAKDIIFVNSQNYYPHDIERLAEAAEGIQLGKVAACGVFNRDLQKEDIVIFVQFKGSLETFIPLSTAIKKIISRQLGLEIAKVVPVKRIPKTTSGKVQRYKLGEAYQNGEYSSLLEELQQLAENSTENIEIEPPTTEKERVLAGILGEVLEVRAIGINNSFYEIGGNSINALQVIDALKEKNFSLNLETLVSSASIRELAEQMTEYHAATNNETETDYQDNQWLNPVPSQRNFYLLNHRDLQRINWWILATLLLSRDGFRKEVIAAVFEAIINYHPALQLRFMDNEDELRLYSADINQKTVHVEELTVAKSEDIETVLFKESTATYRQMDLTNGPLLGLKLFHTVNGDYLLICVHHYVCDGASLVILIEDFATGYKQASQNQPIAFRQKTASFSKWIKTIYQYSKSDQLMAEIPYWQNLEKYAVHKLPKDNPAGKNTYGTLERAPLLFTVADTKKMIAYSVKNNLNVETLLATAISAAICNWADQKTVLIEHTFNSRDCTLNGIDITRSVGWFAGSCPVLIDFSQANSIAAKLEIVNNAYLTIPNNGFGYLILEQITFFQNPALPSFQIHPEILLIYHGEYRNETNKFGFEIPVMETGDWFSPELIKPNTFVIHSIIRENQLRVSWEYSREQYQKETITDILRFLEDFMLRMIKDEL